MDGRWDPALDFPVVATELVDPLRVVARVGPQRLGPEYGLGLLKQRFGYRIIVARAQLTTTLACIMEPASTATDSLTYRHCLRPLRAWK